MCSSDRFSNSARSYVGLSSWVGHSKKESPASAWGQGAGLRQAVCSGERRYRYRKMVDERLMAERRTQGSVCVTPPLSPGPREVHTLETRRCWGSGTGRASTRLAGKGGPMRGLTVVLLILIPSLASSQGIRGRIGPGVEGTVRGAVSTGLSGVPPRIAPQPTLRVRRPCATARCNSRVRHQSYK